MTSPWKNESSAPNFVFNIYPSSAKAIAKIKDPCSVGTGAFETYIGNAKYPYKMLKIGESFAVPMTMAQRETLTVGSKSYGKNNGKKFSVITWREFGVFEVARIE